MKVWEKNINESIEAYLKSPYEKYRSYERFKFLKEKIGKRFTKSCDFLDIGCAKGEFIWYMKDFFPEAHFTGIDISKKLISMARKEPKLQKETFIRADAQNFNLNCKFDFALMSGVLSIFDDFKIPLRQMAKHLRPGGWGYIFGCFTEDDIDVLVRYRNNYLRSSTWESGLNMFSLNTVQKALKTFSKDTKVYKFNLPINLAKKKNPVQSYTLDTKEKGKIILNGANILNEFYLIEFRKK